MPANARFCPSCGTLAAPACASCGEALTPNAHFCPACGTPVSGAVAAAVAVPSARERTGPVAERRVTSVLFADLVGFTPLSESRDAEEVRELLSRYFSECRTVIGRYGGTVEKFIGDAVMAVWGVPVAHEDDAGRAVRAGLELVAAVTALGEQEGAPGLAARVGVVTGEVAVTVGATAEGMVAGDAVNSASRVQSVADPGRVWVDEATRELTGAAITYGDVGEHALKGKSEPMHLWQAAAVVGELASRQRVDGLEAPLIGRSGEMRQLKELFHATESSGRPRLVVLDGDAGMGKSRMAWEFEKYIDGLTSTVAWHRGRCLSYGDGVAFWALAEAFRVRLGLVETDSGDTLASGLEAGLARLVPEDERDWLRPRLAVLLGTGPAGGFAREDLFAAWTAFLERVGGGDPVVLVIDDAQYADDGLLDFLEHLLVSARTAIFVLALARPELLERRHDLGGRRTSVVRVDALDEASMAELIDGLVDGLPATVRQALVERADGVPLFAVETVRALIDRDLVLPREGRYVLGDGAVDLSTIGAPASLQALVAARLDALTPAERRVVADGSVLGVSFTRDSLQALAGDVGDLDAVLIALQRKEILAVQTDRFSGERGQYRFVQGVFRQVAYGTQSRRDRKARHLAAADYLAGLPEGGDDLAVVIAQHYLDAVDASSTGDSDITELSARARAGLERAAHRAQSLGSPGESLRLSEAALGRTEDPADMARLRLMAAEAAWDTGRYQGAGDHAAEAAALFDRLERPLQAALAAAVQAKALASRQDNSAAIELLEPRWRALDGTPGAEGSLLKLAAVLRRAHQVRAEAEQEARYAERILLLAERVDDRAALAEGLTGLGIRLSGLGAPEAAIVQYRGAAAVARELDLPGPLARALFCLCAALCGRDIEEALSAGRESLASARRSGIGTWIDYAALNYALSLWAAGRLREMSHVLEEATEKSVDPGIRISMAACELWLADALGEPAPARPDMEATDNESDLAWLANLRMVRGLLDGDPGSAASIAEQSIGHILAYSGLDDDFVHLWPWMLDAALAAGNTDLAAKLLEPVTTAPSGIVPPGVAAQLPRLRGLVAAARGGDPSDVETELRAGVTALERFGNVGQRARAEAELGRWLVGQGRADEAEQLLERARETFTEIGATGWLRQLDAVVTGQVQRGGAAAARTV
jgi:class 3 adenylate cyclase